MNSGWIGFLFSTLFLCGAQAWWIPVSATPYDTQMRPIRAHLVTPPADSSAPADLDAIAALMRPVHRLPYRSQTQWPTAEQVRANGWADCKGKALLLLDQLSRANVHDTILVIGQRTPTSRQTHVWLELTIGETSYLLDPTFFTRPIHRHLVPHGHYKPHFAYAGTRKWTHASPNWLLASR